MSLLLSKTLVTFGFRISRRKADNGGGKEERDLTHFSFSWPEGRLRPSAES